MTRGESVFHLVTSYVGREAKTRIQQRDCLKLISEKIRREQVGTIPTFFTQANSLSGQRALFYSFILWQSRK